MAALPRTRRIEEILRQAQLDPRLISIITEIAERQRVQHEQLYGAVKLISDLQDHISQLHKKMQIRDGNLEKLGVKEMMTNMRSKESGNLVTSVEEFDEEGAAHNIDTGRKQ